MAVLLVTAPAAAEDFCTELKVPDVLDLDCRLDADGSAVVQGVDTPLAALNRLRIRRLEAPVADPEAWLREQMSLDTSGLASSLQGWVEHPDNPIKPEALEQPLASLLETLRAFEAITLSGCEEPRARVDDRWSMRCRYDASVAAGSIYQELRVGPGLPVAIDYRAASAQRSRQFEALINGFRPS